MLCEGKSRSTLSNAWEMFAKAFSQNAPSLANVNGGATMAGDTIHKSRGQTGKRLQDGYSPLAPKVGIA